MVMSYIFAGMVLISILFAAITGNGSALAAAIPQGAQAGITLSVSLAGSICLWSGVGRLLDTAGFTGLLSKLLAPLLHRLFPSTKKSFTIAARCRPQMERFTKEYSQPLPQACR